MEHYLLTAHNVTRSQRMAQMLSDSRIPCTVQRLPVGLSDRGCAYGVRVSEYDLARAVARLQSTGLSPVKVFTHTPYGYREVTL